MLQAVLPTSIETRSRDVHTEAREGLQAVASYKPINLLDAVGRFVGTVLVTRTHKEVQSVESAA